MYNFQIETSFVNLNPLARNPGSAPASTIYFILFTWASPYGTRLHCPYGSHTGAHMGPIWASYRWLAGFFKRQISAKPECSRGGGVSIFFCMRRLEPSTYLSPPKISGISSTQIFFTRAYVYMKISEYPPPLPGSVLA